MNQKVNVLRENATASMCTNSSHRVLDTKNELNEVREACIDLYGQCQCNMYMKAMHLEN